jgi:hypothetical protein
MMKGKSKMATVKDLIEQLNDIEDKEQPIIFQYFLAEHFEFSDLGEVRQPTLEQFDEVVDALDHESLWDDARETINDYAYGIVSEDDEEDE